MKNYSQELTSIVQNSALGTLTPRDIQVAEHVYQNTVAMTAAHIIGAIKERQKSNIDGTFEWRVVEGIKEELQKQSTRFYGLSITGQIKVGGSNQ